MISRARGASAAIGPAVSARTRTCRSGGDRITAGRASVVVFPIKQSVATPPLPWFLHDRVPAGGV